MNFRIQIWDFKDIIHRCYQALKYGYPVTSALLCNIPYYKLPLSTHFGIMRGIVIREAVEFGENCNIKHGVNIIQRHLDDPHETESATIGNNVLLGANCVILGPVKIGDNAKIGAGAIVLSDVPAGYTITGVWK